MSIFSGKALERMKRTGTYRPDQEIVALFLDGYKTHVKNKGTLTASGCMNKFNLSYPELERALTILTNDSIIYADDKDNKIKFYSKASEASGQSQKPICSDTRTAGNDGNGDFNHKLPKRRGRKPFNASQEQKKIFEEKYSDYFNKNRGFPGYGDIAGSDISDYLLTKIVDNLIGKGEARIEKAGAKKKIVLKKYEGKENDYIKTALVPANENPLLKLGRMFQKSPAKNEVWEFEKRYGDFVIQNGYCPELPECMKFAGDCAITGIVGQLAKNNRIRLVKRNGRNEIVLKGYDRIPEILKSTPEQSSEIRPSPQHQEEKSERRIIGKIERTFFEKYREYLENKGQLPGISEFVEYSDLHYPALKKLIDRMKKEGTVKLVRVGKEKKIELVDPKDKNALSQEMAAVFTDAGAGNHENGKSAFDSLLKNAYVKGHLSNLMSNNGSPMKPEIAAKIVSAVPFYVGKEDKKILEALEADPEASKWFNEASENEQKNKTYKRNKNKKAPRYLSNVQRYLFELFDKKIVSYNVEENDGWRTYLWHISPSAPAALKKSCISDLEEKKKSLEVLKQKGDEFSYFCIKDKTHPVIPFGSKSYVDKFACDACGSGLVLEAGSNIAETIDTDLKKLNAAIGDIEKIKV